MKKFDLYSGYTFKTFKLIYRDEFSGGDGRHYFWFIECNCGKTQRRSSREIRKGEIRCDCHIIYEDLTNKIFGTIQVLETTGFDYRYGRKRRKWSYKCLQCGIIKEECGDVIKYGDITSCGNKGCRKRGENHWKYNPDRFIRNGEESIKLRNKVLKRDKYTCIVCKNKDIIRHCHHLNSWYLDPENRFNIDNCVTLCAGKAGCHYKFHTKYSFGRNTIDQFLDFIKDDKNLFNEIYNRTILFNRKLI